MRTALALLLHLAIHMIALPTVWARGLHVYSAHQLRCTSVGVHPRTVPTQSPAISWSPAYEVLCLQATGCVARARLIHVAIFGSRPHSLGHGPSHPSPWSKGRATNWGISPGDAD